MNISVVGTGYVGLSLAVLLAQRNSVQAVDIISTKVDLINQKKSPIVDKEIEEFLATKPLRACLETSAFIVTRRHVDKKRLCAAAKTREDCQTVPQRSDGQRMGACTSSPAPCFWRRSEAQNRPA